MLRCSARMCQCSYKSYLLLLLLPYLLILGFFHTQLGFFRAGEGNPGESGHLHRHGNRKSNQEAISQKADLRKLVVSSQTYHFRDLMLKPSQSEVSVRRQNDSEGMYVSMLTRNKALSKEIKQLKENSNWSLINRHRTNLKTLQYPTRSRKERKNHLDRHPQTPSPVSESGYHSYSSQRILHLSLAAPNLEDSLEEIRRRSHSNHVNWITYPDFPVPQACIHHTPTNTGNHSQGFQHHQVFQPLGHHYLYTAYLDTRSSGPAYVRIISLIQKKSRAKWFCHFPVTKALSARLSGAASGVFRSVTVEYYQMCENHNKDYGGWILSCQVPEGLDTPCEVVVSPHSVHHTAQGISLSVHLPVFTLEPAPGEPKMEFGVCIPPLFGHIPSTTLLEFIELTQLLGADHLVFYLHDVTRPVREVLDFYRQQGVLTVVPWQIPVEDKAIWYHGQLLAINDCLYRSMHRFRYVAFNDIDEFIVPHTFSNWSGMIWEIQNSTKQHPMSHSGYSFHSAFFDPLVNGNSQILYDVESDLRTKLFSKIRTKVMVAPDRIFELGIHHISKAISDAYTSITVEPSVAFIHHYRKCITDFDPKMNCQIFARDESVARYVPVLRHNVHKMLWILKELEKTREPREQAVLVAT